MLSACNCTFLGSQTIIMITFDTKTSWETHTCITLRAKTSLFFKSENCHWNNIISPFYVSDAIFRWCFNFQSAHTNYFNLDFFAICQSIKRLKRVYFCNCIKIHNVIHQNHLFVQLAFDIGCLRFCKMCVCPRLALGLVKGKECTPNQNSIASHRLWVLFCLQRSI